jgi:hypothetical protein
MRLADGLRRLFVVGLVFESRWGREGLPNFVELANPVPNPMRMAATFRYAVPRAMPVSLALYDVAGRRVRVLVEGLRPAGEGRIVWDGRDDAGRALLSGLFVLRLAAHGWVLSKRVVTLE